LFLNDFFNFSDIKKYIKKNSLDEEILERSIINIKYKGYIEKEKKNANKLIRLENIKIPKNFNYKKIISLSKEGLEKLIKYRPYSIANASRISGVSPSDISILLIYMKR
jgi:tRNA uridine 5-carboxymethylaminomethyl modification enzyme